MFAANWIMSPSPPPPPSIIAWECCAVSIASTTDGRFPEAGQRDYTTRSALGYGRSHHRIATGLRLRQPRCLVVPLSAEQVAAFWKSFRTFRDLAIVALMLLDGLRSCEVLQLQLADLSLSEAHLCVLGKGNKKRVLPLPAETIESEAARQAPDARPLRRSLY
jgi:integrase